MVSSPHRADLRLRQILDLETQEQLFKAKNVRHDFLDMRVPVWIRDLHVRFHAAAAAATAACPRASRGAAQFLNAGTAAGGSTDGFRVVTATEYHQVGECTAAGWRRLLTPSRAGSHV